MLVTPFLFGTFRSLENKKTAKFWLTSALIFLILSLGPILHIFGNSDFTVFHVNVPLPELLFFYISPIPRAPSRFMVLAILSLAVLSAIAIKYVNDKFISKFTIRHKVIGLLFLVVLCGAYFAEINMVPFPVIEKMSVPAFYQQISKENGKFGVIDLPQNYWANNYYMFYSTVSEKPIVGGAISRVSPTNLLFLQAFPIINQMAYVEKSGDVINLEDILIQDANLTNLYSFQYFNVKYVILHRDFMTNESYKQMDCYLSGLLGSPVYCDEQIKAFSTNSTQLPGTFSFLSSGWYDQEEILGVTTRSMSENGTIDIVNPIAQNCSLNFTAITGVTNKNLKVVLNGEQVGDFEVNGEFSNFKINSLPLKAGLNQLTFCSDQYFVPANIYLNNPDPRLLSIAFQNVSILPQLR